MNADMLGTTLAHCRAQVKTYDEVIAEYTGVTNRRTAHQIIEVFKALLSRYDIRNHKVQIMAGMGSSFIMIDGDDMGHIRWGEYRPDLLKGIKAAEALVAMNEYISSELSWEISQYMDGKVLVNKQGEPDGKQ